MDCKWTGCVLKVKVALQWGAAAVGFIHAQVMPNA